MAEWLAKRRTPNCPKCGWAAPGIETAARMGCGLLDLSLIVVPIIFLWPKRCRSCGHLATSFAWWIKSLRDCLGTRPNLKKSPKTFSLPWHFSASAAF